MAQMFNPAHPGLILREWLGEMQVSVAAEKLHVSRKVRSRILNGKAGISAEMSLRLSDALGTNATFFYRSANAVRSVGGQPKRRPKIGTFPARCLTARIRHRSSIPAILSLGGCRSESHF